MDIKKSIDFYIIVFLILLGLCFVIHYVFKRNILDLMYAGLLLAYSFKLSYMELKRVK